MAAAPPLRQVVAPLRLPLADAADGMLADLAAVTRSPAIAALDGQTLLGERAMLSGFRVPRTVSAGGSCRLLLARGDWVALNLARDADRDLLPALFQDDQLDGSDDAAIASATAGADAAALVVRGREMGLAVAAVHEPCRSPDTARPNPSTLPRRGRPRVLDLSALWAGPLAGHLLHLAGADVIKVETPSRPDAMREGQPAFFALLNGGKRSVLLDLADPLLLDLISEADIVIEAARPRALFHAGIDADALIRRRPGLTWLTITAHGSTGDAADWVGFGDDVGVAAGLSAALWRATGSPGFVGDAVADPLTGIRAALVGWEAWASGRGGRHAVTMRDVTAGQTYYAGELTAWAAAAGQSFPEVTRRSSQPALALGADPPRWSC